MPYDANRFNIIYLDINVYEFLTGPTNSTMNDFWKMVWQENVTQIVMLTNLMENGKVDYVINLQRLLHFSAIKKSNYKDS